jgi:MoaA/NifB/PqqE/SkfB family radical SAM enzyme/uncharacterized cupin superfamily protein
MTFRVSSDDPSSTTSNSRSVRVWSKTERRVRAIVSAALKQGMIILKSNGTPGRPTVQPGSSVHRYYSEGEKMSNRIRPTSIRLEASSACQLRCPSCPTHGEAGRSAVGVGFLKLTDFEKLLQDNPKLSEIELSNYGEIFLNSELLSILECAYERGVALKAGTGVNFNNVSENVLEALVKYRFESMTCSIDGATEETYRIYRVGGSLRAVLDNIRKLNSLKEKHRSALPRLRWQFVVFGHNEHEIAQARELAEELGMEFRLKLPWDPDFSPVRNETLVRREIGAASRDEYRRLFGMDYRKSTCHELWTIPQINWDGRVLGCSRNFWGDFGGNAFSDGLVASVNNAGMRYAREMLLGRKPPMEGIPCSTCSMYLEMGARGKWLNVRSFAPSATYRAARYAYRILGRHRGLASLLDRIRGLRPVSGSLPRLVSRVYPLALPLLPDGDQGWRPFHLFKGFTPGVHKWSCHVSALAEGVCPHPPHRHKEEEILMLLSGEVDLVVPDGHVFEGDDRIRIKPGEFVYYPANFAHTIQTTSHEPANYLMLRWFNSKKTHSAGVCRFGVLDSRFAGDPKDGYTSHLIFRGPTEYLQKLRCHASALGAGKGYDPHVDRHEVAIIVLEGEVETLGQRVVPHGVILCPAGEPHGMHNPGTKTARYVVFELHGSRAGRKERLLISVRRRLLGWRSKQLGARGD